MQHGDDQESGTIAKTGGREYELSHGEEQVTRICIDGLHTAGLGLGFQVKQSVMVQSHKFCVEWFVWVQGWVVMPKAL